jgi:hypothetical protein
MRIRVPKNQILKSKYTSGGEYIVESTHKPYQGYYYELNGKTFAGKEFNEQAPVIIKLTSNNINPALLNPQTNLYTSLSKINLQIPSITSVPNNLSKELNFYCKKINNNVIKIINEESYLSVKSHPLYQSTYIGTYKGQYQSPEQADLQLPGVKVFKESELAASSDSSDNFIILPNEKIPPSNYNIIQPQKLPPPPTPIGNITDTPKPQDIVPVGPIIIINS